jgi:hypothetical protein
VSRHLIQRSQPLYLGDLGRKKDKGRVYEEIVELLEGRPDLREEITEAEVTQVAGMRILGGNE